MAIALNPGAGAIDGQGSLELSPSSQAVSCDSLDRDKPVQVFWPSSARIEMDNSMRVSFFILMPLVCCYCTSQSNAEETDPRMHQIVSAKESMVREEAKLQKVVNESLEERESSARKRGNKELLTQIIAERKAFSERAQIPKTPEGDRYIRGMRSSYSKVVGAYGVVIQNSTKKGDDSFAEQVERERDTFMESFVKENPALASTIGTCWVHSQGSFEMSSDGMWQEKWGEKKINSFREVNRGLSSVELFDPSRKCRVILHADYMEGSIGDVQLQKGYSGAWKR